MRNTKFLKAGIFFLTAFALWTAALCAVDRQPIGPMGSYVGFACINRMFHNLAGVHMTLYKITDWLSIVPIGFIAGFAGLGILQWIQRRSILKVDRDILLLGVFYFTVFTEVNNILKHSVDSESIYSSVICYSIEYSSSPRIFYRIGWMKDTVVPEVFLLSYNLIRNIYHR